MMHKENDDSKFEKEYLDFLDKFKSKSLKGKIRRELENQKAIPKKERND